tara:strand:- start:1684 stop:2184 length:501 start_codon:yes stop_codon:yes gene_type:complete
MKTAFRLGLLVLSLSLLSSCKKDDDTNTNTAASLASFLKGSFEVSRADYDGTISTNIGNIPLQGTGKNTSGSYLFESNTTTSTYLVNSTMEVTIFGQTNQYPINVSGGGSFDVINETSFSIDDPENGLTTYQVSNRTANSMMVSTDYSADTMGGSVNLRLDIYLSK